MQKINDIKRIKELMLTQNMLLAENIRLSRINKCRNEFARKYAARYLSQSDEDGLTCEIVNRIEKENGFINKSFCEIGVGDGTENNTLVLLSKGWSGIWYGAERLLIDTECSDRLDFEKVWVDKENIVDLYEKGLKSQEVNDYTVLSIDIDGNDFYILETILESGYRPECIVCEYNGIFPPEVDWVMPYNAKHIAGKDHYYGASLGSLNNLLRSSGYFLCACNPSTGVNAFFVKNEYANSFKDVPDEIGRIYVDPYYMTGYSFRHHISPKFIENII